MSHLVEQTNMVPREEQERLAQVARAYYIAPSSKLCDPSRPSRFDSQLLSLFDLIEAGYGPAIDAQIETLRLTFNRPGSWTRFKDRTKVGLLWRQCSAHLQHRDGQLGKTDGMWQLRCDWNRISLITNRWTTGLTIAPAWIGPAPLPSPPLPERAPYDPESPALWFTS